MGVREEHKGRAELPDDVRGRSSIGSRQQLRVVQSLLLGDAEDPQLTRRQLSLFRVFGQAFNVVLFPRPGRSRGAGAC